MKVFFVVENYISGTNLMRGERIVHYLNKQGFPCQVVDQIPINVENSILVFIGSFVERYNLSPKDIMGLKERGNKIILDPVDKLTYIRGEKRIKNESIYFSLLDGIIFPNKFSEEHFMQTLNCSSTVIYHQYDDRFLNTSFSKNPNFEVRYVGALYPDVYFNSTPNWLNITNIEIVRDTLTQLDILKSTLIHFSHRSKNILDFYFKPSTKVGIAAGTDSVFLTSKDKSVVELLGEDYPLYIDEDIDKTSKLVNHLKNEFGKNNLDQYIQLLKPIKEKLNINNVCKEYINFFKEF